MTRHLWTCRRWGLLRLIACAMLLAAAGAARGQTGAVYGVHDPSIIKQGDTYYLFCTGNGIPIRRSKDLVTWENAGTVFQRVPAWAGAAIPEFRGRSLWAPDISRVNGKFCLYYSVSTFASDHSCIGLAINETLDPAAPNYKWVDQGKVIESTQESGWNAIDPNLVAAADGKCYLAWGSFWGGIEMTRLDPTTGKPAADPPEPIALAHRGRDNGLRGPQPENAVEAPCIFRHGEFYYLFISVDMCCRGVSSTYKVLFGRSRQVTGPYLDRSGRDLAQSGGTLLLAGYGDVVRGPGHEAVLHDGDKDWLVHHMYDATRRGQPRLQIRPLLWDAGGWPVAGGALQAWSATPATRQPPLLAGAWTLWTDFQTTAALTLKEDGSA